MQKFQLCIMKSIFSIVFLAATIQVNAQYSLEYFLATAKKNSPLITENINRNKANAFEVERLKAFFTKPQIGMVANYMFSPVVSTDNNTAKIRLNADNATNYYGYDLSYSNGGQYQAMLQVTQPLFNNYRYNVLKDQLDISSQINQNYTKLTEHDIEKLVTDQYIFCLQDLKQISYAEKMVQLLNEQKVVMVQLVKNNLYKQSDLSLLNIEYNNSILQLNTYKANYRKDLLDLYILCGIDDTTQIQIEPTNISIQHSLKQSNFLEKYRLDSLNLIAEQNVFELKYKPEINFFANAGLNAVYFPTIPYRFGFSAGISFSFNLYDGNQKIFNRNKTQVLGQTVSFYKNNFITQNSVRQQKIRKEIQSYSERITLTEQQLKDYEQLLDNYKTEILSGQLPIFNYTAVLKNMASVQRDVSMLYLQKQLLINSYNYWNW